MPQFRASDTCSLRSDLLKGCPVRGKDLISPKSGWGYLKSWHPLTKRRLVTLAIDFGNSARGMSLAASLSLFDNVTACHQTWITIPHTPRSIRVASTLSGERLRGTQPINANRHRSHVFIFAQDGCEIRCTSGAKSGSAACYGKRR